MLSSPGPSLRTRPGFQGGTSLSPQGRAQGSSRGRSRDSRNGKCSMAGTASQMWYGARRAGMGNGRRSCQSQHVQVQLARRGPGIPSGQHRAPSEPQFKPVQSQSTSDTTAGRDGYSSIHPGHTLGTPGHIPVTRRIHLGYTLSPSPSTTLQFFQ